MWWCASRSHTGNAYEQALLLERHTARLKTHWRCSSTCHGTCSTLMQVPLSEDSCEVRFDWYLAAERTADAAFIEHSLAASHAVQLEDVALCEDVQRGLSSPAYGIGR